jgi:glutaminyl-peptide cyclotransferase
MNQRLLTVICALLLIGCEKSAKIMDYTLVSSKPHDDKCYTQGLEFYKGNLLESAGRYGESNLRLVEPATGKVLRQRALPRTVFAEGLTLVNGELWLLTWKEQVAYVFNPETFELIRRHTYEGEGWGLTHDGEHLIMSNGSNHLTFRNPKDFSVVKGIDVTENGKPVDQINELEWVDGHIWANIYKSDRMVCIDAKSGKVTRVVNGADLRARLPQDEKRAEEFNGIAHDPATGHLWVTGKYWPTMYEIAVP